MVDCSYYFRLLILSLAVGAIRSSCLFVNLSSNLFFLLSYFYLERDLDMWSLLLAISLSLSLSVTFINLFALLFQIYRFQFFHSSCISVNYLFRFKGWLPFYSSRFFGSLERYFCNYYTSKYLKLAFQKYLIFLSIYLLSSIPIL